MSKKLLDIRKKLKKKRPSFHREDSHKVIKIKPKWRKPTGSHSKVRHQLRGYVKRVEPGYRSPAAIRGTHKSGLFPVIINNIADLNRVNKEKQGIVIAARLGKRKKVLVLNKAKELGITILNVKNVDAFVKSVDDFIKARKEKKQAHKKKKESKEKEKKKKSEKKPELDKKVEEAQEKQSFSGPQTREKSKDFSRESEVSVEDKKQQEKKELDKELSKRKR
jgi:large subunit ribosomal protein L32e